MGRTIVKQIRVTREEAERARNLLDYFPECATEAEILRLLLLRGLMLTEAELTAGGAHLLACPPLEKMTAMVLPRILPLLQLLKSQGILTMHSIQEINGSGMAVQQRSAEDIPVDPAAALDLLALGTSEL